jgi:hypothetical protein
MENGTEETAGFQPTEYEPPILTRGKQLLPCTLTTEERLQAAERMALLIGQRDNVAADLREFSAQQRDRLKHIDGEIAQVAARLRSGSEDRIIAVVLVANTLAGTADTLRTDTGEMIASRPLTDQDRQQAFNFRDPAPEPDPEAEAPAESGARA